ncbi:MAG: glycosyltransferase [Bacteroidota bacterium]
MKLSIITINLNNREDLERTIQSVVTQNFNDFEYIIIDGGSDDGSIDVITQYPQQYIKWISEKDTGIYHAMNKGIHLATGEYCLFLNSGDSFYANDILENIFATHPVEDILYGDLLFEFNNNKTEIQNRPDNLTLYFLFHDNIWHPATFIKKNLFHKNGFYDERFRIAGDYEFFFRNIVIKKASTRHINFTVSRYNTSGISSDAENLQLIEMERRLVHLAHLTYKEIHELEFQRKIKSPLLRTLFTSFPFLYNLYNFIHSYYSRIRHHKFPGVKKTSITFFTPTFWRTGSEVVLFNLLNSFLLPWKINAISLYKGELAASLPPAVGYHYIYSISKGNRLIALKNRFNFYFKYSQLLNRFQSSIWYINTIALPEILEEAERRKVRVWLHVHELEQIFKTLTKEQEARVIRYPELIIANSKITAELLCKKGRTGKISLIYPAINTAALHQDKSIGTIFRRKAGFAENGFLWVMAGTIDSNKNPLLFIRIAREILQTEPSTCFLWIGIKADRILYEQCINKLKEENISDAVKFIEPQGDEFINYFQSADGFVLTSTAESFSLVTLQAMLLGLPIVAADCGGVNEVLTNDYGKIVKGFENVSGMVKEMLRYQHHEIPVNAEDMRKHAESFDINSISLTWNKLLLEQAGSTVNSKLK